MLAWLLLTALLLLTGEAAHFVDYEKWPNGEVVYQWSTKHPMPERNKKVLQDAFTFLEDNTCIKFYHQSSSEARSVADYRTFYLELQSEGEGCWSRLGRSDSGPTLTNLGPSCYGGRIPVHETMHALGMPHEQSRFDRDQIVHVYYGNISSGATNNFDRLDLSLSAVYGPYDLTSVMHYRYNTFSKDLSLAVMELKSDDQGAQEVFARVIRGTRLPSHYDLEALNLHYDCTSHCSSTIRCKHDGFVDKNCRCKCAGTLGGSTCEEIDSTGITNTPGCGGEYRVMSAGDSYTFSEPTQHRSSPCAWFFTSGLDTKMKIVVHKLILGAKYTDQFEVRHLRPGQRGVQHERWPPGYGYVPPAPPTRTANIWNDYSLDPAIAVLVRPTTEWFRLYSSKFDFSATVTVTADSSMRHAYVYSDAEEDWPDLWYVWESSRTASDRESDKSDEEAAGGGFSFAISPSSGGTEWLQTKTMWDGNTGVCVDFEYHGTGFSSTLLDIQSVRRSDLYTSTHDTVNDNSYVWTSHSSIVTESDWFAVRFSYGPGSSSSGDMYLDNINIIECGSVPPPQPTHPPPQTSSNVAFYDDFEADFETTWLKEGDIRFAWIQNSGKTPSTDTGPTDSFTGYYYAYLECSGHRYSTGTLSPRNTVFDGLSDICVKFRYHMQGDTMGSLELLRRDYQTKATTLVWSKGQADVNPMWQTADFVIPATSSSSYVELVFQATCGIDFRSDIALDDVDLKSCGGGGGGGGGGNPPPTAPPATETISLDFEDEYTWDNEITNRGTLTYPTDGNDYWGRHQGSTPSGGTGPDWAHGGSYYIYMEASTPNNKFETADLIINRVMETGEAADMDFWFHMYGGNMGDLQVLVVEYGGAEENILWQRYESYVDWLQHTMTVPTQSWQCQIMFRAIRGDWFQSDIALDDIQITFRQSVSWDVPAPPPSRGDSHSQRAHAPPYIPGHIEDKDLLLQSFEKDLQGFEVLDETPLQPEKKWSGPGAVQPLSPHSGETKSPNTGPKKASAGQYYLLFEAVGLSARATASLVTMKSFDGDEDMCVLFDYHMYGSETGKLEVLSRDLDRNETSHWQVAGQNVDAWQEANVVIPPQPEIYQIVIRVTNERGSEGDIGIDNVLLAKGPCKRITVGQHCQSCDSVYESNTTCHGEHLDGRPYCSAYGFARDSLWNSVNCMMLQGYKNGYVSYRKTCVLPSCSLGYNAEADTDDVVRTLHFTTDCQDANSLNCEICCPDHCDASGAARFSPETATALVTLGLTLLFKLLIH